MKKDSFKDFILDQISDLGEISCRSMFGGFGLYSDTVFFGIVYQGRLYFKTDSKSRSAYVEMGMKPFRPNAKQTLRTYYEVPLDVLEDTELLLEWAHKAVLSRPIEIRKKKTPN